MGRLDFVFNPAPGIGAASSLAGLRPGFFSWNHMMTTPVRKRKRTRKAKVSLADITYQNLQFAAQMQGFQEVGAYLHHLAMLDLYGKRYLVEGEAVEQELMGCG